jgi:hypothetical protein
VLTEPRRLIIYLSQCPHALTTSFLHKYIYTSYINCLLFRHLNSVFLTRMQLNVLLIYYLFHLGPFLYSLLESKFKNSSLCNFVNSCVNSLQIRIFTSFKITCNRMQNPYTHAFKRFINLLPLPFVSVSLFFT